MTTTTGGKRIRLTDTFCGGKNLLADSEKAKAFFDGAMPGLYLHVRNGAKGLIKYWRFAFSLDRKRHLMGIGTYPMVPLSEARARAAAARALIKQGINPIDYAKEAEAAAKREQQRAASEELNTFERMAERMHESKKGRVSAEKIRQYRRTLGKLRTSPHIGE